ncbi:MAG: hypothetical protein A4S09_04620 [Proteobacteria bacterium SG_bin7]|nr:MAG: hypothetical protein A4S09_04620 [Proteobacteria bacterium SG_bin7]
MIIYEVTLEIDFEIIEEFQNWLIEHVNEMLATRCFTSAEIFTETPKLLPADGANSRDSNHLNQSKAVVIHYKVGSESDLNEYFLRHASRLRAPAVRQFGAKFRAKRRVLKLGLS